MIKDFEVIFGPGGESVGGWTIHRRGDVDCLDPRTISELPWNLMIECRRNGEVILEGFIRSRGLNGWWSVMDEPVVFYRGTLLPLSIATAREADLERELQKRELELEFAIRRQKKQQRKREKAEQAERERREKYRQEQRVALQARESKRREQRRGFSAIEWYRMAHSESCFLELLSGTSPTDWLLDRLSDHDFIEMKFRCASWGTRDWHQRRRWLTPL